MTPHPPSRPWYRWPITVYDRLYRLAFGLDRPAAQVGPAVRLAVQRCRRTLRLADGTVVRPGDLIGVLHLHNERVAALHGGGVDPWAVGLQIRRQVLASLRELAGLAEAGGRLAGLRAFTATTIFHRGLRRLGFEPAASDHARFPLAGAYQRALLASLHPDGPERLSASSFQRAERLWISRQRLRAMYGAPVTGARRSRGAIHDRGSEG